MSDSSLRVPAYRQFMLHLEELLYRMIIAPAVAFLPARLAYGLACRHGDWRYRYDIGMRKEILCNLEGVLGDQLSLKEQARLARDFFRRRSCEIIDVIRLAGKGRALARLVELRGLEHIEVALAGGKGAVICSAHFGSFSSCFSLLGACGFPVTTVGDWRSTYDPAMSLLQRFLWHLLQEKPTARHRHKPNIEPGKDRFGTALRMAETLEANEVITIALETPVLPEDRARSVPVDFLGRKMLLLPGSISVAQLTGSPVLVLVARRQADWAHQVLEISPPVPLDGDTAAAFQRCVAMIEAPVQQNLAHWDYWESAQNLIDFELLPARA